MDESEADRGQIVARIDIAMIVIATTAVALRFWSRAIASNGDSIRSRFWWDDWFCLLDLPFCIAELAIELHHVKIGLGKHMKFLTPEKQIKGLKLLYGGYFVYDIGICLAKFSALLFYARLFSGANTGLFRFSLWATAGLVVAWLFFAIPSTIWQCTPIAKAWNPLLPGHCLDNYKWWLGSAISSVIIDAIILTLPLRKLWKLQLKPLKKLLVAAVLVCGYCVIVVSIGRLVATKRYVPDLEEDYSWNTVPISVWLDVETPISILSICLPSIFALIKRGFTHGASSLFYTQLRSDPGSQNSRFGMSSRTTGISTNVSRSQGEDDEERLYGANVGGASETYCLGTNDPRFRAGKEDSDHVDGVTSPQSVHVRQVVDVKYDLPYS